MKKLLLSFILGVGFGAYGYAVNSKPSNSQLDQKEDQEKVKKFEHYDFSLFKFIAPKVAEEKDSLKKQIPKNEFNKKNVTTYNYEKPLTLFKLS